MALFVFLCPSGHVTKRILPEATPEVPCRSCGAPAQRKQQGPSTLVLETVDNGLQARATVRLADAERIFKEISIQDDLEHGGTIDEDELAAPPEGEPI